IIERQENQVFVSDFIDPLLYISSVIVVVHKVRQEIDIRNPVRIERPNGLIRFSRPIQRIFSRLILYIIPCSGWMILIRPDHTSDIGIGTMYPRIAYVIRQLMFMRQVKNLKISFFRSRRLLALCVFNKLDKIYMGFFYPPELLASRQFRCWPVKDSYLDVIMHGAIHPNVDRIST